MIILDTNVISEPMKAHGNPAVMAWLDRQVSDTLFVTAISLAELLAGIENLAGGKRKDGLGAALADLVSSLFDGRILPFGQSAAIAYAPMAARAKASGRAIGFADGQIAAIALSRGYMVATRDTTPFQAASISVINPWEAE